MTDTTGPRPSDRFIPWYIVLFFVVQGVGFAWFYHLATTTYTGLVTDEAYEKGLQYNQVIARADAQAALGWTSEIVRKGSSIELQLKDHGKPLAGAAVRLWLVRPVHAGIDQELKMKETAPGLYAVTVTVAEKGLWEARIEAEKSGHTYQASRRMEF